jgi:hypothetical protein
MMKGKNKLSRDVATDILKRDQKSLDRGTDYIPTISGEVRSGRAPTKLEAMEYLDAYRRRTKAGDNYPLPREIKELGEKGEAEAKALRKPINKMPSSAESAASGNRISKENAKDAKAVAKTTPRKRPSIAASMDSAKRVGRQEGDEMRKMGMAKGGVTRADGCAVRGKTKGKMV